MICISFDTPVQLQPWSTPGSLIVPRLQWDAIVALSILDSHSTQYTTNPTPHSISILQCFLQWISSHSPQSVTQLTTGWSHPLVPSYATEGGNWLVPLNVHHFILFNKIGKFQTKNMYAQSFLLPIDLTDGLSLCHVLQISSTCAGGALWFLWLPRDMLIWFNT
jgi:hypothetical protein